MRHYQLLYNELNRPKSFHWNDSDSDENLLTRFYGGLSIARSTSGRKCLLARCVTQRRELLEKTPSPRLATETVQHRRIAGPPTTVSSPTITARHRPAWRCRSCKNGGTTCVQTCSPSRASTVCSENALRHTPAVVDNRPLGADIQEEPARRIDIIECVDTRHLDAVPLRKPSAQILLQHPTLVRRVALCQQKQFVSSALAARATAGVTSVENRETLPPIDAEGWDIERILRHEGLQREALEDIVETRQRIARRAAAAER